MLPGDIDRDGDVDVSDLGTLLPAYNTCAGDPGYNDLADLNDDNCVNISDLGILLPNYGLGL